MIGSEGARLGAEAARRLAATGLYEFEPGLTDAEHQEFDEARGDVGESWSPRATAPFWRDLVHHAVCTRQDSNLQPSDP